ncbi:flagellar protein FlaG [Methylococcus sp. EFPC2]|uniref:flagellar protein FlaG n=1 Tax=Methylococcus sp. EFPC2 TaxID=2812648 RepID=UPI0019674CA3|nr:flagellar protein FlaG [Methylococcus sp. EFPC2]QSA95859.1 flagellar protein FlaG [Methylococcus sp. EFPC2]
MTTANVINGNLPPNTTFLQRTAVPQPGLETGGTVINAAGQAAASAATNAESSDPAQLGGKPDQQQVADAVKDMNKFLQMVRRTLVFTVDEDSGRTVVQIKDADTDQVIRQIPPENMLTIAKQIDKFKGLLFEEKA